MIFMKPCKWQADTNQASYGK